METLYDIIRKDDVSAFESLLRTEEYDIVAEALYEARWCNCVNIMKFLCTNYGDNVMKYVLMNWDGVYSSLLLLHAKGRVHMVTLVLNELESHIPLYLERKPSKVRQWKSIIDACLITICDLMYTKSKEVEIFDNESIDAIEALKKFGASPGEITDSPLWYTHTYDNVLENLSQRSTTFIKYMSTNINYHTCVDKRGNNLFQHVIASSSFTTDGRPSFASSSLIYLMEQHQFDPLQCRYESGNLLHHIHRVDILSIIIPILDSKGCLLEYLWQQDKCGNTPIDYRIKSKEIIDIFQKYDATVGDYVAKKNVDNKPSQNYCPSLYIRPTFIDRTLTINPGARHNNMVKEMREWSKLQYLRHGQTQCLPSSLETTPSSTEKFL